MSARRVALVATMTLLAGCEAGPGPGDDARADARDTERVARGAQVYASHCASCHGANLEGQPEWRKRLPNGRLPAPPHDDSGHTWHHPDHVLFAITKHGLVPPYAPRDYQSDMPGFAGTLTDNEIWAALAYIKSRWTDAVLAVRSEMLAGAGRR